MSRVVYLHIGAPKTGTTYLQDRLARNAATLAQHGVTIPSKNRFVPSDLFHFRAALDLLEQDWGGAPGHAEVAWDALVRKVRRSARTGVVCAQILSPAPPVKSSKGMNRLAGYALDVVYHARVPAPALSVAR